jgi:sigma-B regulation protein RsbU (phosphoserine phosphatase)
VIPADNSGLVLFDEAGCALGLFIEEPVKYIEETYQLKPGDKVIAYTDGLIEWRNKDKQVYGAEKLLNYIKQNHALDCDALMQGIYADVEAFANQQEINDDLTLLVARYN